MPRKKKNETVPVAEIKAEVVTETVTEAPAKKPAVKKTPAKKTATKAKSATKTIAKTTRAATVPKETIKVQYSADEYDFAEIRKVVEADYKGKVKGKIKTVEIYIKPECCNVKNGIITTEKNKACSHKNATHRFLLFTFSADIFRNGFFVDRRLVKPPTACKIKTFIAVS